MFFRKNLLVRVKNLFLLLLHVLVSKSKFLQQQGFLNIGILFL